MNCGACAIRYKLRSRDTTGLRELREVRNGRTLVLTGGVGGVLAGCRVAAVSDDLLVERGFFSLFLAETGEVRLLTACLLAAAFVRAVFFFAAVFALDLAAVFLIDFFFTVDLDLALVLVDFFRAVVLDLVLVFADFFFAVVLAFVLALVFLAAFTLVLPLALLFFTFAFVAFVVALVFFFVAIRILASSQKFLLPYPILPKIT